MLPNGHPLHPSSGRLLVPIPQKDAAGFIMPTCMLFMLKSNSPCSCSGLEVAFLSACATLNKGWGAITFAERNTETCRLRDRKRLHCRSMTSQCLANCCVHLCYVSMPGGGFGGDVHSPSVALPPPNLTHHHRLCSTATLIRSLVYCPVYQGAYNNRRGYCPVFSWLCCLREVKREGATGSGS